MKSQSVLIGLGAALVAAALILTPAFAATGKFVGDGGIELDAPYVPTPQPIVDAMLKIASVGEGDIVYDLGSGDGRLVVSAVRDFNAKKGVGVEIDPVRIKEANANAKGGGVADRVSFHQEDLFGFDFSEATVLTMYLLPDMIAKLRPKLVAMKPGSRIVAHDFSIPDWEPERTERIDTATIYFYTVPPRK